MPAHLLLTTSLALLLALLLVLPRPLHLSSVKMTTQRTFTAQRGFFSHDDDPESWDFRATTRVDLGLLKRGYGTDGGEEGESDLTQWERFRRYLRRVNEMDPKKQTKLFYLIRHGEGVHNVKEREVGRAEWDRHYSKLPGDTNTTWADADLTPKGEQQARTISTLHAHLGGGVITSILTSPLRRCLHTTSLAFPSQQSQPTPLIKENLRERMGVHTCDRRSTRSWIEATYPLFDIEDGFVEDDALWEAERREPLEEHVQRSTRLLEEIFDADAGHVYGDFIVLVAHSGTLMALFEATGWKAVPVAAGAVYPLLICAEEV